MHVVEPATKAAGAEAGRPKPEDLAARVRAALEAGGLSQARAAAEIGISDSALSQWLAGTYQGSRLAMDGRISRWLAARAEREALASRLPAPPAWVETPTARRIDAALSYAQMAAEVAVVFGGAGVGKTVVARRYAEMRPNVWLTTLSPAERSMSAALELAARACGLRPTDPRAARLKADLVARLTGTRGLLVVDEAQHLGRDGLEVLRAIHDQAGVGLALVGSELVYARLTGGRRTEAFAQLFSRIGKRVALARPTAADIDAIAAAWGLGEAAGETVRRIGRQPGGLREVTKAVRLATLFADGEAVTSRHLRAAWRELGGES